MPDLSVPGIPGGISLPFQEPYLEGLLYSRLGILKPIRVLQIQCSEGGWLKKQAEAFPFPKLIEFYGMEEDPSLLHELRRKEPQFLVFGREFLKFGFPEGFFHFLYWDATKPTYGDVLEVLRKARLYLHPEGALLIRYYLPEFMPDWLPYSLEPALRIEDLNSSKSLRDMWRLTITAGFDRSGTNLVRIPVHRPLLHELEDRIRSHRTFPHEFSNRICGKIQDLVRVKLESAEDSFGEFELSLGEVFCLGSSYLCSP
ncbi:hypothetical protein HOF92_12410 [bacterium]|jgi:hypothetical protein|nr:hypothetical protein [bacterium]